MGNDNRPRQPATQNLGEEDTTSFKKPQDEEGIFQGEQELDEMHVQPKKRKKAITTTKGCKQYDPPSSGREAPVIGGFLA